MLEGPYQLSDSFFTDNTSYIEDATAFVWGNQICLLTNDNFGSHTGIPGGGILWKSHSPTHFKLADAEIGFFKTTDYAKWVDFSKAKKLYGSEFKFERPGILMMEGQAAHTFTRGGSIIKSGAGTLTFNAGNSTIDLAAGGLIDVQGGKLQFGNFDSQGCSATGNQSDMNIVGCAIFDGYAGNVAVDSLTGCGTYQAGYFGPRSLTVGINGGFSTFSGTIKGNGIDGNSQTQLIKRGIGTITLTGTINARGAYGGGSVEVRGGTLASPSTLVLSPADPLSTTGYGGGIYISPGNADVAVLEQTAGTLNGAVIAVGEYGQGTYNFSGGTVNAGRIEFAWNGGGNNGPAVMNISGSSRINVNSNGQILMGQFWGRPVTVNQSGGEGIQFSDTGVTRGGTGKMNFFSGNQNLTWNLSGGTLSIAGMGWAASGGGAGGGNGVLNLNGGILQITNAAFAAPTGDANGKPVLAAKVLGDDLTPNSGARFDNYGLAVTFAAPIQYGGSSSFDGGLSLATSVPGGSLTLSGINTYTGDTTIAAANTLILADNAELAFFVDGTDATKITGDGTATLAGDFRIDTSFATTTPGTEWILVDVATRSFDMATFRVIGFTETGDVWTRIADGNKWTFTESSGKLSVAVAPPSYETWIGPFGVSDPSPGVDSDFDGMENLLEYVLNGNPSLSDPAILPDVDNTTDPLNLVFTFTRREESATDTTQVFEYGTNLTSWTPLDITGTRGDHRPGLRWTSTHHRQGSEVCGHPRWQALRPSQDDQTLILDFTPPAPIFLGRLRAAFVL